MSNKGNSNLNINSEGSTQTPFTSKRVLDTNILTVVLAILSLIASYFIFNVDSFTISSENGFTSYLATGASSLEQIVFIQFEAHSLSRISQNINGFVLSFVFIAIGILGILILVLGNMENSRLLCITAIAQIPTGIILIIAASINNTGVERLVVLNERVLGVSSLLSAYWLYFVCYLLLFISSIMIAVHTRKKEYKHLRSSIITISVGLGIMIVAVIFSITSTKIYFEYSILGARTVLAIIDFLPVLLISTILTEIARIMMVVSFLFGIIKFQQGTNRKFTTFFKVGILIFLLLKIAYVIVKILYSFFVPEGTINGLDIIQKSFMREVTIKSLINVTNVLQWVIFLAGIFAVIKSIVSDDLDDILLRKKESKEKQKISSPIFQDLEDSKIGLVQPVAPSDERFCTVCGTIADDESIVCASCGAFVPKI